MSADRERLHEILRRIEKATRFARVGEARFYQDDMVQEAMVRQLEIIGEAANALSPQTRALAPEVPWPLIIAMRNRLIHAYFDIDLEMVWSTTEEDLLPLREAVQTLLARLS